MFLFIPVTIGLTNFLQRINRSKAFFYFAVSLPALFIILFSLGTIDRNNTWSSELNLWTDALRKAPENARPYINLGHNYKYQGNLSYAYTLFNQSLDKYSSTPWKDTFVAFNNISEILYQIGKYDSATSFIEKSFKISKDHNFDKYNIYLTTSLTKSLWFSGQPEKALSTLSYSLSTSPNNNVLLKLKGELLILNLDDEKGLQLLLQSINNTTTDDHIFSELLLDFSLYFARSGNYEKSSFFIRAAETFHADQKYKNLCLLELGIHSKNTTWKHQALKVLMGMYSFYDLKQMLQGDFSNRNTIPIDYHLLATIPLIETIILDNNE